MEFTVDRVERWPSRIRYECDVYIWHKVQPLHSPYIHNEMMSSPGTDGGRESLWLYLAHPVQAHGLLCQLGINFRRRASSVPVRLFNKFGFVRFKVPEVQGGSVMRVRVRGATLGRCGLRWGRGDQRLFNPMAIQWLSKPALNARPQRIGGNYWIVNDLEQRTGAWPPRNGVSISLASLSPPPPSPFFIFLPSLSLIARPLVWELGYMPTSVGRPKDPT